MAWLLWFIPTLYVLVSLAGWTFMGRQEYRELVASGAYEYLPSTNGYPKKRSEEDRLERCRQDAVKHGGLAFLWPVALVVMPFIGTYYGISHLVTSGVNKELEEKKLAEKAQKIVDDYNAKQKAEEEKVWAELEGKEPPRDPRPLKCPMCGLPHYEEDCDAEDCDDE